MSIATNKLLLPIWALILSGNFPKSLNAQVKSSKRVVIDSVYADDQAPMKASDIYYYYLIPSPNFLSNARPRTIRGNRMIIYHRQLPSGKETNFDTLRIFNYRDSLSEFYDAITGIINVNKMYSEQFVAAIFNTTNVDLTSIDSISTKGKAKLIVKQPVKLANSIVNVFSYQAFVDSLIFKKKIRFDYNYYRGFYLDATIFEDTCELGFTSIANYYTKLPFTYFTGDDETIQITNTIFRSYCVLNNSDAGPFFLAKNYEIYNSLYSYEDIRFSPKYALSNILFKNVVFEKSLIIRSHNIRNTRFVDCRIDGPLFLQNKHFDSTTFTRCRFNNLIDLRGTSFEHSSGLKDNYFTKGVSILLDPNDAIENLPFDIIEFEKLFFIVDWGWKDNDRLCIRWDNTTKNFVVVPTGDSSFFSYDPSVNPLTTFNERDFEEVKKKFQAIKDYVNRTFTSDDLFGSGKQRILNWLNYQLKQYEKLLAKRTDRAKYYWMSFIESTVNFGYDGEFKFLKLCLLIILGFSVLFRAFFPREISAYINKAPVAAYNYFTDSNELTRRQRVWNQISSFFNIQFVKSFFTSFSVFFTPRFPAQIFNYSKRFAWVIISEWVIGLLFIILFLYYIAGNYPIVTKILGL